MITDPLPNLTLFKRIVETSYVPASKNITLAKEGTAALEELPPPPPRGGRGTLILGLPGIMGRVIFFHKVRNNTSQSLGSGGSCHRFRDNLTCHDCEL